MLGDVLFAFLPEPGHILPTIPIAQGLRAVGYKVIYLTSPEFSSRLAALGFEVESLSSDDIISSPHGAIYRAASTGEEQLNQVLAKGQKSLGRLIGWRIGEIASRRQLRAIVADRVFASFRVDLKKSGNGAPVILVWTSLPASKEIIPDRFSLNIALCPEQLELPDLVQPAETLRYVEPSIDLTREEVPFQLEMTHAASQQVALCTFGTQAIRYPEVIGKITSLAKAASNLQSVQFIIATGHSATLGELQLKMELPKNVCLVAHAPQITLLPQCALFITHGGLGGIKEAIYFGVPMLVLPLVNDQPENAARVVYHGLGASLPDPEPHPSELQSMIQSILQSVEIRKKVELFKKIFRRKMDNPESSTLIRQVIEM
jgi:UDP:flavonoid glycosyltransferase YjiC (YdhE family)